jgi:hypothetical protein
VNKTTPLPWIATAALATLVVFVPVGDAAAADAPPPVFEGTWIATAGPATLHGRWSAQALPGQPDDLQGSWSMINDGGDVIGQGTWSARRTKRGFAGKWSARAATGGLYTGTFEAALPDFKGKTLQDMFAETKTATVSGYWRMGGARGAWYLKAPAPQ